MQIFYEMTHIIQRPLAPRSFWRRRVAALPRSQRCGVAFFSPRFIVEVMFKGIIAAGIAAFVFYLADQQFYDGRHADQIISLARKALGF